MSLTDKVTIINGAYPEQNYKAEFTAAERDYIARAILKMPQHITITTEFETTVSVMRKLGYLTNEGIKEEEVPDYKKYNKDL